MMTEQQPPLTPPPSQNQSQTLGIVSLCLGILSLGSFCFSFIPLLGIVCCLATPLLDAGAVVCGILGLKTPARTMAIIGIVLGGLSLAAIIVMAVIQFAAMGFSMFSNLGGFNSLFSGH